MTIRTITILGVLPSRARGKFVATAPHSCFSYTTRHALCSVVDVWDLILATRHARRAVTAGHLHVAARLARGHARCDGHLASFTRSAGCRLGRQRRCLAARTTLAVWTVAILGVLPSRARGKFVATAPHSCFSYTTRHALCSVVDVWDLILATRHARRAVSAGHLHVAARLARGHARCDGHLASFTHEVQAVDLDVSVDVLPAAQLCDKVCSHPRSTDPHCMR